MENRTEQDEKEEIVEPPQITADEALGYLRQTRRDTAEIEATTIIQQELKTLRLNAEIWKAKAEERSNLFYNKVIPLQTEVAELTEKFIVQRAAYNAAVTELRDEREDALFQAREANERWAQLMESGPGRFVEDQLRRISTENNKVNEIKDELVHLIAKIADENIKTTREQHMEGRSQMEEQFIEYVYDARKLLEEKGLHDGKN